MVPIAHIWVRVICEKTSCYDLKFYCKPLNFVISAFAVILAVYLLVMGIIELA